MTLREAREKKGLTQAQLASRINVKQAAVSHWENGRWPPLKKYHKKIAKILGCTTEDIDELKEAKPNGT